MPIDLLLKKKLVVLSLGAGVQSSTMALMAAKGEITPMPDCAIFADTQSEPDLSDPAEGQETFSFIDECDGMCSV